MPPVIQMHSIVAPHYCNHIDSAADSIGNMFIAATSNVDGKLNCIVRKRHYATGVWSDIYTFDEDTYGKHGYCTISVLGRHLGCVLSERQPDGTTAGRFYIILDVANAH